MKLILNSVTAKDTSERERERDLNFHVVTKKKRLAGHCVVSSLIVKQRLHQHGKSPKNRLMSFGNSRENFGPN